MTPPLVQRKDRLPPWRGSRFFRPPPHGRLTDIIHAAALAAVFPPSLLLVNPAAFYQVVDGPLDSAAGQLQLPGDGTNRRIAFAILIRPIL